MTPSASPKPSTSPKPNSNTKPQTQVTKNTNVKNLFSNQKFQKEIFNEKAYYRASTKSKGTTGGTGNAFNRGATNTSELNANQFKGLKNNGVVKVNSSGSNRPETGAPNSYYTTKNGEHVFVYDGQGKLIYDLSASRVKAFQINVNPSGKEFYKPFKLEGEVPQFIWMVIRWVK